ncbi:MAG: flagellar assembly protein FliH [Sinomonas sp.]|nr:flagellar assembly protein FliH [Sinomonas sp.]
MSTDASPRPVVFPAWKPSGEAEGFTRGHAAGYAAGLRRAEVESRAIRDALEAEHAAALREGGQRIAAALGVLTAAAAALDARTAPVLAEAEAQLSRAAVALADALVGRELSDAATGAKAALARALSGPATELVLCVRLHPADLALLSPEQQSAAGVTLVPDPALSRGDAVAVYPDGELDARIGTALARASAALAGERA